MQLKKKIYIGIAILAFFLTLGTIFMPRPEPEFKLSRFSKIFQVYSYVPEVTATAYNSKAGNATIIWLSGMDESAPQFGQIWEVYSFRPEVTATAYDSPSANATVIWLTGMDDEERPKTGTSS